MNIEINTKDKTIKVLNPINLEDLYVELKKLLPDNEWKKYTLSVAIQCVPTYYPDQRIFSPQYIEPVISPLTNPYNPYVVTCTTN